MRRVGQYAAASFITVTLLLTGCTSQPQLEVTTAPPVAEAAASPTPTVAAAEKERGTRGNPLAVGESRKISQESMWSVGASAPTDVRSGYVVLPLRLSMDWDAARAQQTASGGDPAELDEVGVNPATSLFFTFVSASGKSYSTLDNYPEDLPRPELWEVGVVFPPAETAEANYAVTVPAEEVAGGVWQVRNSRGDTLYIAQ